MPTPTPHLILAKINKETKELVNLIDNYNDQNEKEFDKIVQLTSIMVNQYKAQDVLHTVRDYIEDKQGNYSTLFYKLFLDNFTLSDQLKNRISEEKNLKANHDVEKSVNEKMMKDSLRQALFSANGEVKINHEQTLFAYLFDNADYHTIAELNIKSFFANEYLRKLPNQLEHFEAQIEIKKFMDKTIHGIIDNIQSAIKNEVINTCNELDKATSFEEIKKIVHTYVDNPNPALVPNGLREGIAWLQPFMYAFDLVLKNNLSNETNLSQNQIKEQFLHTITDSETQVLLSNYRSDCIDYIVGTGKQGNDILFTNILKKGYILNGFMNIVEMEIFQTKYAENYIFNEKQKIESGMSNDMTIENNSKKTKI